MHCIPFCGHPWYHVHIKHDFTIQCPYNNQACYDSSINTLRLESTHPNTYNLVGFSGCLHLWWIPLLDPELLISELCVTSVAIDQFSLTTRLALNEFQASYYSHYRNRSALSETNWLLRASGCNLNLNPYLVIQMGHHHVRPPATLTTGASNHSTVLAQYLAQAEGSRSGEASSLRRTPFRLGEGSKKHPGINAGSRLGETPLAWARCLLAQKFERVAWATLRTNWFGRIPVCLA
ncbi:hypothetical protein DEO72_LG2g3373 [Vigna unguiculata]|uniref:Uncharacterized protein n=1 Tax=Vigna unguiculata TaxID=3917 RepID=A0A4D6L3F3_VIGUN|nr:hypothetical protein DEO72_LG2g3373 [Vigna unguiculata]